MINKTNIKYVKWNIHTKGCRDKKPTLSHMTNNCKQTLCGRRIPRNPIIYAFSMYGGDVCAICEAVLEKALFSTINNVRNFDND